MYLILQFQVHTTQTWPKNLILLYCFYFLLLKETYESSKCHNIKSHSSLASGKEWCENYRESIYWNKVK